MTLIAAFEAIALVAVVYLLLRHFGETQAQWAAERRELLNRIQRPEHIPLETPEHYPIPDEPPDEIDLVGTIAYMPEAD